MKVDPAGLVAAAQRLTAALAAVSGDDPVHPPLGVDPASMGAALRLSTAGSGLAAGLAAHTAGLVETAETLGLASAAYTAADEDNAGRIATLTSGGGEGPRGIGNATPVTPLPADIRSPLAPIPTASGEALSIAVHDGDPTAGQTFAASWQRVAGAAADAAGTVRSVVAQLPELLESPHAAPSVAQHLLHYADGFESASRRAAGLAQQANEHAAQRLQAGQNIPTPSEFAQSRQVVEQIAVANARSGGLYAVPLAEAEAAHRALDERAVTSYAAYHGATDATTSADGLDAGNGADPALGGDPSGDAAASADQGTGDPTDPAALDALASGQQPGDLAGVLPSMIPAVLGAAGGLLGGLVSSVAAIPAAAAQAGTQAVSAAASALSGALTSTPDNAAQLDTSGLDSGAGVGGAGDLGGAGGGVGDGLGGAGDFGGGAGETTPASGGLPPVTPTTGWSPTAPAIPAGVGPAAGGDHPGAVGGGMMPMGMPMGGAMGGGGAPTGEKKDTSKPKKVVVPEIPHTEAVTGKVSGDRVAVSATAPPNPPEPPTTDSASEPPVAAVVKRITNPARDSERA